VNFEQGSAETSGFRFVGEKGILHIHGDGVRLERHSRPPEPGYNIETFAEATQREYLREYRKKYPLPAATPDNMRTTPVDEFLAAEDYSDHAAHMANFFAAVRNRKPVTEDAVFGLRAAGPALLANSSHFERKICGWDPQAMERT